MSQQSNLSQPLNNSSRDSGGATAVTGFQFQAKVAAWMAVQILAEQSGPSLWDLSAGTTLKFLRCETEFPVDDLLIGTSEEGCIFVQVKHTTNLERTHNSALAATLDQFVRQYAATRQQISRQFNRPLDPGRDRFVLITGPGSSGPIRLHTPSLLQKLRQLLPNQTIDEAPTNADERRALTAIKEHLEYAWQKVFGIQPTDENIRELLSLVWVTVLDFEDEGSAEREAQQTLRSAVLQNPDQANQTWNGLVTACLDFASNQSGGDRAVLAQVLQQENITLQEPRSYRADIRRLREYSRRTLDLLKDLSIISVGAETVKIKRHSTDALHQHAETGPVIVVGEPGAGKSGTLHDLVDRLLEKENRDVVFFAVDRVEAQSLGALRSDIGLDHDLLDVLKVWLGSEAGFLVIDALDAARSDHVAQVLYDLIQQVVAINTRWHIVASIRKFDLRHHPRLRQLFRGTPVAGFADEDFPTIRHLNVPKLQEDELRQIGEQSVSLARFVDHAPEVLRELLRVPFNLRLIGELLGEGVPINELNSIQTQLQLLDRYWAERVTKGSQGDAREAVLRQIVEEMVRNRTLRVDRALIANPTNSATLHEVLSSNILMPWRPTASAAADDYILTFSHHVIFDYATARLLLRGTDEAFLQRLVDDPELVLAIRPSLVFHFQYIWSSDPSRNRFWDLVLRIIPEVDIPEVGKLIGPTIAAELAAEISDFEPLLKYLAGENISETEIAEKALQHIFGALFALMPEHSLVGEGAGPWSELLERTSVSMRRSIAYIINPLLFTLCEQPETLTAPQREKIGTAARRFFEFVWELTPRDSRLVISAIRAVCRTFSSDPTQSAVLLRKCLEETHLAKYGYEEIPWLAHEISWLFSVDPELVAEIYEATFRHEEKSKDPTSMGGSQIIPMTSNRAQDYRLTQYSLAEAFPKFLELAPIFATHALIGVIKAYVAQRHSWGTEIAEEVFDFNGQEARIKSDYSSMWDTGAAHQHDDPIKMLDAFEAYLSQIAKQEHLQQCQDILATLIENNSMAVIWKRLLKCGARSPDTWGQEIQPLAWARPILICTDTNKEAGDFLNTMFGRLSAEVRERIERVILLIPVSVSKEEHGQWIRNRLLGCLPPKQLVTDEARQLIEKLAKADQIPPNIPHVSFGPFTSRSISLEEYLAEEGVPVEEEPNQHLIELEKIVEPFSRKYQNAEPTNEDIQNILPILINLHNALLTADEDGVHPQQKSHSWGRLAEGCERIARYEELSCEEETGSFVRTALLEAADYPDPSPHPEYDAQFDRIPSWGSPAARIDAADGLIVLARHPSCVNEAVLGKIEKLSNDPVPAVRFQIATKLNAMYNTAPELMWRLLEKFSNDEVSNGVLQGLLGGPINRLLRSNVDRVINLIKIIYDRITEGEGAQSIRETCASAFAGVYVWHDHALCREVAFEIAENPLGFSHEAGRIVVTLREPLAYEEDGVRRRSLDLMQRTLRSVHREWNKLIEQQADKPTNSLSEAEQEQIKTLAQLVDSIGSELYFTSGAFREGKQLGNETDTTHILNQTEKQKFFEETRGLFEELAQFNLPRVTHHLLQTLEPMVPVAPAEVFLQIGYIVRASEPSGYQYESLAADLVVKLVERYLAVAEYRIILRERDDCRRTLIEILDIFVRAGWPSARRLTYRMEEIFR